jgi:hypothetical protein
LANLTSSGDGGPNSGSAGSGDTSRYDAWTVSGPAVLTSPALQGGERYEEITLTKPGVVSLSSASIQFSAPLVGPKQYVGHFLSSSDLLNRIWYAGAATVDLNEVTPGTPAVTHQALPGGPGVAQGAPIPGPELVDGAKRDREIWAGDLGVSDRTAWDAYGQPGSVYPKGSLEFLAQHPLAAGVAFSPATGDPTAPGPMPGNCPGNTATTSPCQFYSATYSIDFVLDVYDEYLYSGDRAFLNQMWPLVHRELAWENEQVDQNGLFLSSIANGGDWNLGEHPAGEYSAPNVLHVQSLLDGAALADAIGDASDAQAYRSDAAAAKRAIENQLWDPSLGAFDASTTERGFLVQDANVWAVMAGIPAPAQTQRLLDTLDKNLASPYGMLAYGPGAAPDYSSQLISPFIGSYALWAEFASDRPGLALALVRAEWGWMVNHDPGGTDWERIHTDGTLASGDSAAHGWSTGATSALSQYVLGIQPTAPGFARWLVRPEPAGLSWAQGTVPTARGSISARWRIGAGNTTFKLTVAGPANTQGAAEIPRLGAARDIAEDGRVVWEDGHAASGIAASADGDYVLFPGLTGTHTFAWSVSGLPRTACPAARGRLSARAIGPIRLGEARAALRTVLRASFTRSRGATDFFCLTPIGIRVGYATPSVLGRLRRSVRRAVRRRVVLILTANRHFALDGIRPGTPLPAVIRRLHLGAPIRIGRNRWYLVRRSVGTGVLKVRGHTIEEVGIADRRLTAPHIVRAFLVAF